MGLSAFPSEGLLGRRKIYTDKREITDENVVDVVGKALATHRQNRAEIEYLYDYYRGRQDVRLKEKKFRSDINNKVTVNLANQIVTFKVSYLLGDPLQYVSRGGDETISNQINELNELMYAEGKEKRDKEVAEWAHICGVGCRMVTSRQDDDEGESPFVIITLDPREAFVIYSSGLGEKPMAGVIRSRDEEGQWISCVYTKEKYYEIANGRITKSELRTIPYIPLVEYVYNSSRMGSFETVIPLLNELNTLESNRIDDIEQFVQSILVFKNCEITEQQGEALKQQLGLMIKSEQANPADVFRIDGELSQDGAQTISDNIVGNILTITGMPNRNGGSSTSDTGAATIMRDGWQDAEARAKDSEDNTEEAEREFLRIALYICHEEGKLMGLNPSDIRMKFTRHNYADIQSKAQVLAEMLNNPKIHPKLAFQACGMFADAEDAYRVSMEYYEEQKREMEQTLRDEVNAERGRAVLSGRSSDRTSQQEGNKTVRESAE